MSDLIVLPNFPGQDIAYTRTPLYTTNVQNSASGREVGISYESFPRYQWALKFNALRDYLTVPEAQQLEAIFHLVQGRGDYFLFADPEYNAAAAVVIGVGTGTNPTYRLTAKRTDPLSGLSFYEPVQNPYAFTVYVNGVAKVLGTDYTMATTGVVTFLTGKFPAAGTTVTWTGNYRYRCRLLADTFDMARIVSQIWSSSFKFRSVKV